MVQLTIGTFSLGWETIHFVFIPGQSSWVLLPNEKRPLTIIQVGAEQEWHFVVAGLIHEVDELLLDRAGARFQPGNTLIPHSDTPMFIYDHATHSDKCDKSAYLLTALLPTMATMWSKWNKGKRDKEII